MARGPFPSTDFSRGPSRRPCDRRALRAEEALIGKRAGSVAFADAAKIAAQEAKPVSDLRGTEAYKRAMIDVFTRRALETALERTKR
jgi:carbon-monoxide dehydrogenase medium subunit